MNYPGFILANAFRNKRRTTLTILSLAASVFLLATLEGLLNYMVTHAEETGSVNRIIVRRKTSLADRLPESYIDKVAQLEGIDSVTPMVWFGGIYKEFKPENFFGQLSCDPETFQRVVSEAKVVDPATGKPSPELYEEFKKDRAGAIAGWELCKQHGWKLGERITLQGMIYPINLELTLRAAYHAEKGGTDNQTLYYHHKYIDELLGRPGLIGIVSARVKNSDDIPRLIEKIDGMFANSDFETLTETEQAFQLGFVKMMGNLSMLVRSIGMAIAFTMLMVAANTTAMAARERAQEIGVMKAIGFVPGSVLTILMIEATIVALIGASLGAGIAYFGSPIIEEGMQHSPMAFFFAEYTMKPWIPAAAIIVGAAVGIVSSFFPCWRVVRLPISTSLRRLA
ncbi:MAG: ABC transporter permease [Planctomycetota bacterium]